jgi:hypothetical protein
MGRWIRMAGLLVAAAIVCAGVARAQDAATTTQSAPTGSSPVAPQSTSDPGTQPQQQQDGTGTTSGSGAAASAAAPGTTAQGAQASGRRSNSYNSSNASGDDPKGGNLHIMANNVSITLSQNWAEAATDGTPPPRELRAFAPPFHLNAILTLQNVKNQGVLQLAMSDNPLLNHDSSWLDEQMHMPGGTGMSVMDMLFYYFFPPSAQCMDEAQRDVLTATFAPTPAVESAEATGAELPYTNGTAPMLQVTYHCRREATLDSFYSSQLSNGIVFAQSNDGPRAYSVIPQFYLAPMEQVRGAGISWYVFEAQRTEPVPPSASTRYNVPIPEGAQPDYFYAIGAPDPFPWTADVGSWSNRLIHVAYVGLSMNNNRRSEFISLLQRVRIRGANGNQ